MSNRQEKLNLSALCDIAKAINSRRAPGLWTTITSHLTQDPKPPEKQILILGLDGNGKTTYLSSLGLGPPKVILSTIGSEVETLRYENLELYSWDTGGCRNDYRIWNHYFQDLCAVIYVLDASDPTKLFYEEIGELRELYRPLITRDVQTTGFSTRRLGDEDRKKLRSVPWLFVANKADIPTAIEEEDVIKKLELGIEKLIEEWHVQSTSVVTGEGMVEGLQWLASVLDTRLMKKLGKHFQKA